MPPACRSRTAASTARTTRQHHASGAHKPSRRPPLPVAQRRATSRSTIAPNVAARRPAVAAVGTLDVWGRTRNRSLAAHIRNPEVERAMRSGWSWPQVAEALGVTRQAVHKKHAQRLIAAGVDLRRRS